MVYLAELENLPVTSEALGRLSSAYVSVVDYDPTSEPPRKSPRRDATQQTPSSRSVLKGKGRAESHSINLNHAAFSGPRVLRVNNLASRSELPTEYTSRLAPVIKSSIRSLLDWSSRDVPFAGSYEQVFNACHILVTLKDQGQNIYDDLRLCLEKSVTAILRQQTGSQTEGMAWLKDLVNAWRWFEARLSLLHSTLMYLDRYIDAQPGDTHLRIRDLGRHIWNEGITRGIAHQTRVHMALEIWLTNERDKNQTGSPQMDVDDHDRSTVKAFIELTSMTDLYAVLFLEDYQRLTQSYFEAESERLQISLSPSEYVLHCARRAEEELQRLKDCCNGVSWGLVLELVDQVLARPKSSDYDFSLSAISAMLQARELEPLRQMYRCYRRCEALSMLRLVFKDQIRSSVVAIVQDVSQDNLMISRLMELKSFTDKINSEAFRPENSEVDKSFTYAVRDAFENGFTQRKNKPAEMLAKYLDSELRKGQQGASDVTFQKRIDAALGLYGFSSDHDVFRIFYMRALAKRLLLQRSASDDFEKSFLVTLGKSYDQAFEKGLKMFEDLETSRMMMNLFQKAEPDAEALTVRVFQPSNWPTYRPAPIMLPENMRAALVAFEEFYVQQNKGRSLTWIHSLGTVTLTARFPLGQKELAVSLYQAVVLLLFDEGEDKLTFKYIRDHTDIELSELQRTMQSLALGKKHVLIKTPATKEVKDDDTFTFNRDFQDPNRKIRINSIQVQETAEENKETEKEIDVDRDYVMDAAIVRIMKAQKSIEHEQLILMVTNAVSKSFKPQPPFIKKRIASLIESEYIARDEKDISLYHYLA